MTNEPDPYDRLLEAANRVAAARASDKDALWIAGLAGGGVFLWLSDAEKLEEPWTLLAIVTAFGVVYRIAKVILYRQRGLGWLPLFGSLLPSSVPLTSEPAREGESATVATASPAHVEPRSASVPRLPSTRTPPDAAVVGADLLAVETLRAGRSDTKDEDLPLGVLMVTSAGIAFLPEARDQLESMFGDIPGALLGELAGELLPPVQHLKSLQDFHEAFDPPPPLAEWMQRSLRQKHAFVIAWGDLVGAMASPVATLLERRTDEGDSSFRLLTDESGLVTALMQRRLVTEMREIVLEHIIRPKARELLPAVEKEMADEGDAADRQTRARTEAAVRAGQWYLETSPPVEALLKAKLQPALEGYAQLPGLVEAEPGLFADGEAKL